MRPSGIPPPRRNQSAQAALGASLGQRLYTLSKVGNPRKSHDLATPCRLGRLIPTGWGDSAWPHALPPRSGGVSLQKRSLERRPKSQPLGGISLGLERYNLDLGHLFARKAIRPKDKKPSFCSKRQRLNGLTVRVAPTPTARCWCLWW